MTIRHVVVWKLAAEDEAERAAHAQRMADELLALKGVVPSIRDIQVGPNAVALDGNWDAGLVADFDDEAGLREYLVHPAHQAVVGFIRSVVADRAAIDLTV